MKTTPSADNARAFTVLELLCVIGIIVVLAALVLPALGQAKARAKRIQCVQQLHQTGLAFLTFAHEHDGRFPMSVGTNAGGSLEYLFNSYRSGQGIDLSFHHFQTLADELRTPKVLNCPADTRSAALSFPALKNENLSYFVGINAEFSRPNSILSGDRNLTNDYSGASSLIRADPSATLRWTRELHEFKGNLLFADGRVEENNSPRVAFANGVHSTTDLALPGTVPASGPVSTPSTGAGIAGVQGNPGSGNNPVWPKVQPVANVGTPLLSPQNGDSSSGAKDQAWVPRPSAVAESRPPNSTSPANSSAVPASAPVPPPSVSSTNPSAWLLRKEQPADPGFSLFPQSMAVIPKALVKKSTWPLWILLLLLIAGLLARFKFLGNGRDE